MARLSAVGVGPDPRVEAATVQHIAEFRAVVDRERGRHGLQVDHGPAPGVAAVLCARPSGPSCPAGAPAWGATAAVSSVTRRHLITAIRAIALRRASSRACVATTWSAKVCRRQGLSKGGPRIDGSFGRVAAAHAPRERVAIHFRTRRRGERAFAGDRPGPLKPHWRGRRLPWEVRLSSAARVAPGPQPFGRMRPAPTARERYRGPSSTWPRPQAAANNDC